MFATNKPKQRTVPFPGYLFTSEYHCVARCISTMQEIYDIELACINAGNALDINSAWLWLSSMEQRRELKIIQFTEDWLELPDTVRAIFGYDILQFAATIWYHELTHTQLTDVMHMYPMGVVLYSSYTPMQPTLKQFDPIADLLYCA